MLKRTKNDKGFKKSECLLFKIQNEVETNLKRGNELVLQIKDGKIFTGILLDIKEGYLEIIVSMGILMMFPVSTLTNIFKV